MKTLYTLFIIAMLKSCSAPIRFPAEPKPEDKKYGPYHTRVTKTRMDGYLVKVKGERGWIMMPKPYHKKDTLVYYILVDTTKH